MAVLILRICPVDAAVPGVGEEMAHAAKTFLATLAAPQKEKAVFPLGDEERFNFHFIPRSRKGLPIKEMTHEQRPLALGLLNTALSAKGFVKATSIMSLEEVLRQMEGANARFSRDPELYYFSIFGTPDPKGTWGWRVEGHHLALNFLVVKGQLVSSTPSFMGTNPAEIRTGNRQGLRVLGTEEDLGRELARSLRPEQLRVAWITNVAPADILTEAKRKVNPLSPAGLLASKLNGEQTKLLMRLVREYVGRCRGELAAEDMRKIEKAGVNKISFAWAGPLEPGKGHYYRVQGPTFLLEYDNTQNNANHVHAVWRDFAGDFGVDLLQEHYRAEPHGAH